MTKWATVVSAMYWYHWLAAAAVLFAVGVVALWVLGDGNTPSGENDIGFNVLELFRRPTRATGMRHTLAYSTWLFSWLGAIATFGLAIFRVGRPPSG